MTDTKQNTPNFHVPPEGMKVLVICGKHGDRNIWRRVGKVSLSPRGKLCIIVDKVFNPAGCFNEDDPNSATVILHAMEYSDQDKKHKSDSETKDTKS